MISAAWQLFVSLSRGDLNRIAQVIFECKLFYPQLFNNFFNNFGRGFVSFYNCFLLQYSEEILPRFDPLYRVRLDKIAFSR